VRPVALADRPVAAEQVEQLLLAAEPARAFEGGSQRARRAARQRPVIQRDARSREQHGPALAVDEGTIDPLQSHACADARGGQVWIGRRLDFDVLQRAAGQPVVVAPQQARQRRVGVHDARRAGA
jgi:hypothetical protein